MLIAAEGIVKPPDDEDLLRTLMIEALLLDIGFVVGELIEGDVLIKMVVDVGRAGRYRIRLGSEPLLPVDVATDIV